MSAHAFQNTSPAIDSPPRPVFQRPTRSLRAPGDNAVSQRAVVIGAGFGGIASALRLRARGMRVTLVDRLPMLGGRARVFERDGYTFDAGPTVITAPYLLAELFELFGERFEDHVDLRPVWPWYRVQWGDGATFDYGGSPDQMCEQIAKFRPEDQDGYRKMLRRAEEIYRIGYEQLGDHPFDRASDMARAVPDMIRLGARRSMYEFVASHLKHERLRQVFTFQPLLVGGNPFNTSCIYALIQPLEQRFGVHYAMGGTGAIVRALGALMERVGIDVVLGQDVEQVEVSGDRVTGVRLRSGKTLPADIAVSNADPVTLYSSMLPEKGRHRLTRLRAKSMKLSMGLFVSYFGTTRTYPDLAHHTILLSDRYKELLTDIFDRGIVPEDPSLYMHAPTRTDPSMAPEGHECFYVLAPVPNLSKVDDWESREERFHDLVLERIESCMAPGLRGAIDSKFCVTPRYFRSELRSPEGAGFSVQPRLTQSAYFRFHNRCPHYKNLFLVGAGTHPGAGIPGTLCTAKTMENCLLREGVVS
ncbi:MAG: phytoene desaturase family protein [Planctomycetota bacterium]